MTIVKNRRIKKAHVGRVYSKTWEEYLKHVETVLEAPREHQLQAHTELWNFNQIWRMEDADLNGEP